MSLLLVWSVVVGVVDVLKVFYAALGYVGVVCLKHFVKDIFPAYEKQVGNEVLNYVTRSNR